MNMLKEMVWLLAFLLLLGAYSTAAAEHVTYFHNDGLGSPVAATNAQGEVLWTEAYDPYGDRLVKPEEPNRLWYTGKPEESELGLTYFGARWYEPRIGRFHGVDPKEVEPEDIYSFNRYAYANDNPYKYMDPDGKDSVAVIRGMRISTTGDSKSRAGGYAVYAYTVYRIPNGTPAWAAETAGRLFGKQEGSFELVWTARSRKPNNRGTVLSDHSTMAEVSLSKRTTHHIRVTDVGSDRDVLTQELGREELERTLIRLHYGGPDGSEGCGTTVNGLKKEAAEDYLIQNMPSLTRRGERTLIKLPEIGD